jgi:hypothetical protein
LSVLTGEIILISAGDSQEKTIIVWMTIQLDAATMKGVDYLYAHPYNNSNLP